MLRDLYVSVYLHCRIIVENNGKPPLTYNRMQAIVKTIGPPKKPISAPSMEDMNGSWVFFKIGLLLMTFD